MTYKEFLEALEEVELDLDSAAEALDLEISEGVEEIKLKYNKTLKFEDKLKCIIIKK